MEKEKNNVFLLVLCTQTYQFNEFLRFSHHLLVFFLTEKTIHPFQINIWGAEVIEIDDLPRSTNELHR